jgi:non-specific serine/threonine protein kinase/serine/threonine-protein kinase
VTARKDTSSHRTAKFVGRNRTGVAAAVLVLVALVAGRVEQRAGRRATPARAVRAEQRFEDVLQLAKACAASRSRPPSRDLPGSTPDRRLLVSKGLEYLDRLARDAGDRPTCSASSRAPNLKVATSRAGR